MKSALAFPCRKSALAPSLIFCLGCSLLCLFQLYSIFLEMGQTESYKCDCSIEILPSYHLSIETESSTLRAIPEISWDS